MPEMKRSFTAGKMNKDLDERLVPSGEYRDAMNIQVSTADDSDVGTVQNLLGNIQGCTYPNNVIGPVPPGAFTVGSISDEKNDALYWLVSGQDIDINADDFDYSQLFSSGLYTSFRDIIMRKTPQGCEPVFVDKYAFTSSVSYNKLADVKIVSGIPSNVIDTIEPGWTVTGVKSNGDHGEEIVINKVSGKNKIPFNYEYTRLVVPQDDIPGGPGPIAILIGILFYISDQFNLLDLILPALAKITNIAPPLDPTVAMAPIPGAKVFTDVLIINPNTGGTIPDEWEVGGEIHFVAEPGGAAGLSGCISEINKYDDNGNLLEQQTIKIEDCATGDIIRPTGHGTKGYLIYGPKDEIELDDTLLLTENYDRLFFRGPRTLNFNHCEYITGLNIVDDMLFWTDNKTEPKKINISRSIEGTDEAGDTHTFLVNKSRSYGREDINKEPVREKHITVIRRSPKNTPLLELIDSRDPTLTYTAIMTTADGTSIDDSTIHYSDNASVNTQKNFSGLVVGDVIRFQMKTDITGETEFKLAWKEGDQILLKEFDSPGEPPNIPFSDWTIRAEIQEWELGRFTSDPGSVDCQIEVVILGIQGSPPLPDADSILDFAVDLEMVNKTIFEFKFPRFSYRYKYEDGEYSTFAPWSQVAFLPGSFVYDPKEGWNTGMTNRIEKIKFKDFITDDMPEDVVSVDILYKEEKSPNVYIIDTIDPLDDVTGDNEVNFWESNEYLISSETVKATLASNQMLRSWDNVPIKALAQEVSGNRIIYGNYLQGHNLQDKNTTKYKPEFKNSLGIWSDSSDGIARKSIKSLRDYKLGVVFTDKYGRETPILTSESGGFKVEKKKSISANRLKVGLRGNAPKNMTYYKFYIKETASEYYNMPMDRWYNAEDGNVWLAFPSSDRNKVDIDTTLFLKKGEKGDMSAIGNTNKYKVLAIENEAPRFIKTRKLNIGSAKHDSYTKVTTDPIYGQLFGGGTSAEGASDLSNAPIIQSSSIHMNYVSGRFGNSSVSNLDEIREDLYIHFVINGLKSSEYKISKITSDRGTIEKTDLGSGFTHIDPNPSKYFVTLDRPLEEDVDIIYDSPITPTRVKDGVKVIFTKEIVENSPKFDGRFFVKIKNDGEIKADITTSEGVNYAPLASKMVYSLDSDDNLKARASQAHKSYDRDGTNLRNYVTSNFYGLRNSIEETFESPYVSLADIKPSNDPGSGPRKDFNHKHQTYNARQAYFGYIQTSYT